MTFYTLRPPYKGGKVILYICIFLWGSFVFLGCLGFAFFKKFLNYVVLWGSFNGCGLRSLTKTGGC